MKWLLVVALVVAGCGAAAPAAPVAVATPVASRTPYPVITRTPTQPPTPEPTPGPPTPVPTPKTYAKLNSRSWALLVKSPDNYLGNTYVVWACITQFDAATGPDTFRADASYGKLEYWFEGDNTFFAGEEDQLADFVQDDVVVMNVMSLGSYSYDTQAGGNTTVPLFSVDTIDRKGSCE